MPTSALAWSVPVSYWIGPDTAAVLHIRRFYEEDDAEVLIETDIDLFCRVDGAWRTSGGGGGGWKGESPLARIYVPPRHVDLHGVNGGWSEGRGCKALWGEVGTAAAIAEVDQAGTVTRHPVEAPVGAFVAAPTTGSPSPCGSWTSGASSWPRSRSRRASRAIRPTSPEPLRADSKKPTPGATGRPTAPRAGRSVRCWTRGTRTPR